MNSYKTCSKCKVYKHISEFGSQKDAKNRKQSQCKKCRNIKAKEYRDGHKEQIKNYQNKHREKLREYNLNYQKKYRNTHKDKLRLKCKEYYHNHTEENSKICKNWREAHRDEVKIIKTKWQQSNAGKISQAKCHARRKRELGYIPLNNRFIGCEGHHINTNEVIFIPADIHNSIYHRLDRPETMVEINKIACLLLQKHKCGI